MRKQPIALSLALAVLLAGCGGASDEEQPQPADGAGAGAAEAPAPAPATPPASAAPAAGGAYDESALPAGVTLAMVEQGRQLYAGGPCVACHGPNAEGGPLAPNLTDDEWINVEGGSYEGIVEVITNGVPNPKEHPGLMPPKGGGTFTDDQVRALAAYVYMLSHRA